MKLKKFMKNKYKKTDLKKQSSLLKRL